MLEEPPKETLKMALPELSIVIVNFNTADLIGACLDSLASAAAPSLEVFVIDNASTDGSAAVIRDRYPWVRLVVNSQNRGFAAANNQVLPQCRGRHLLYLNPDTRLAGTDVLAEAVRFLDAHPRTGLAGARLINPDGSPQESISWKYPSQRFAGAEVEGLAGQIACVMGAAMIARTDLIRQLGGFDEDFTLYGEDQDLCLRIRRAGYEIGYVENAPVIHYGGQSERQSLPAEVWRKKTRAEYLFYRKHYRPGTVAAIRRAAGLKVRFRLISLALTLPFLADRTGAEAKRVKYRAVWETLKAAGREGEI